MKITAVTSLYRPHIGGVETMVEELGHVFYENDHSMDVVCKKWPDTLAESEDIDGISIRRMPVAGTEQELIELATYFRDTGNIFENTDVVHLVGMRRPLPFFAAMIAQVHQIPAVGSIVGSEIPNPGSPESEKIWHEGDLYMPDAYRALSTVTAVSQATSSYAQEAMPWLEDKIEVLPVGIDTESYNQLPAVPVPGADRFILALRRLEKSKGIDILISAYNDMLNAEGFDPGIKLVIAGDGPERKSLESLVVDLGIAPDQVLFLGSVTLSVGIGLLKSAVVTVVPSLSEGGGLVNTEANAVGCPLIASDVGGIREYTTEQASRLVTPGDSTALTTALIEILSDSDRRTSMINAGYKFAAERDWKNYVHRYIDLYERALQIQTEPFVCRTVLGKKLMQIIGNEV